MPTVYLVTSGQYSDYRVNEVFAHKEDAERHVAEWNALLGGSEGGGGKSRRSRCTRGRCR